ncbi:MAG: hypothetical protein C0591_07900 [Marinilabiliales bacterium]|nr:MAG: hypothetical protein C0591_07900 [Marinilabiliales bacterium]
MKKSKIDIAMEYTKEDIEKIRVEFQKRRKRRVGLFVFALGFLLIVGFVALPLMDYYGVPRLVIGLVWRCPVCNGILGDVFTTKYCTKCGFHFSDKIESNDF